VGKYELLVSLFGTATGNWQLADSRIEHPASRFRWNNSYEIFDKLQRAGE
jgi:hypothetical protein